MCTFLVSLPSTKLEMSSTRRHNRLRTQNSINNRQNDNTKYIPKNPIKYDVPIVPDFSFLALNEKDNYYCNSGCVSEYGNESNYLQLANHNLNSITTNNSHYNFKCATLGRSRNNTNFDENQHLTLSRNKSNEFKSSKSFCSDKNVNNNLIKKSSNCVNTKKNDKLIKINNNRQSLLTSASMFPSVSSFTNDNSNLINKHSIDDSISLKSQQSQYSNCSFNSLTNMANQSFYDAVSKTDLNHKKLNENDRSLNLHLFSRLSPNNFVNKIHYLNVLPNQLELEKCPPYVLPEILNANASENVYFNCQGQNLKPKNEINFDKNILQNVTAANKSDENFLLKSSLSVSLLPSSLILKTTNTTNNNNSNNKSQNNCADVENIAIYSDNNKTYKNNQGDNTNDIDRFSAQFDEAQNFQGEFDVKKSTNKFNNCINGITRSNCENAIRNNEKLFNTETKQKNNKNFNNNNQILNNNTNISIDQHWNNNLKSEKGIDLFKKKLN